MIRSKRGLSTLEKVVKPRKFWRYWGEFTLWTCRFAMIGIVALMLLTLVSSFSPRNSGVDPPSLRTLVAVPGLNPMIPLGWGLMAFIIALVLHEFAHGIMARAHGMRVRSFGLLMLGPLPLGAFAEPEQDELRMSPRRERQRLFAAGPGINLQLSTLCAILLIPVLSSFVPVVNGVHARGIVIDAPADEAGIEPYEIMTHYDGVQITSPASLRLLIEKEYTANSTAIVSIYNVSSDSNRDVELTFSDRYEHYMKECQVDSTCDESTYSQTLQETYGIEPGEAFIGISGMAASDDGVQRLILPLTNDGTIIQKGAAMLFYPLQVLVTPSPWMNNGRALHPEQSEMLIAGDGWFAQLFKTTGLFLLVNGLFWLMWTNLILGLFNLIPLVPFDGGHMFRDRLHDVAEKSRKIGRKLNTWDWHPIRSEEIAGTGVRLMGWVMGAALLLPLIMLYL